MGRVNSKDTATPTPPTMEFPQQLEQKTTETVMVPNILPRTEEDGEYKITLNNRQTSFSSDRSKIHIWYLFHIILYFGLLHTRTAACVLFCTPRWNCTARERYIDRR